MSIIRSFTTRRGRSDESTSNYVGRAASQRAGKPVHRAQISSPLALLSSTNALSYEAPLLAGVLPSHNGDLASGAVSTSPSADDSDTSTLSITSHTDASSLDDPSPLTPEAEPNHLSCYFKPAVTIASGENSPNESTRTSLDAPIIPKRVPSHSKKAHEQLHRQRSARRMMSPPPSVIKRASTDMFKPVEAPRENPFNRELAQLDEVAEELSRTVRDAETDADVAHMKTKGLAVYAASDYLSEIHGLLYEVYLAEAPSWI